MEHLTMPLLLSLATTMAAFLIWELNQWDRRNRASMTDAERRADDEEMSRYLNEL